MINPKTDLDLVILDRLSKNWQELVSVQITACTALGRNYCRQTVFESVRKMVVDGWAEIAFEEMAKGKRLIYVRRIVW